MISASRSIAHIGKTIILCIASLILAFHQMPSFAAPKSQISTISPADIATPTPTPQAALPANPIVAEQADPIISDHPQANQYTVRGGDTLWTVALEIGVDLEEMNCMIAPDFTWDQPLVIGDTLQLPAVGTPCHEVQPGETVETIAAQYGVTPQQIMAMSWNNLIDLSIPLIAGTHLRMPPSLPSEEPSTQIISLLPRLLAQPATARQAEPVAPSIIHSPISPDWPYGTGDFVWPVYGWISQGYHHTHRAVDLAAPIGTLVAAADRGVVIRSGWNEQGYGLFVVLDHNIDYVTLYSHLSQIFVEEGQIVAQGDIIGRVGSTGNSTGPHLHFEIRDFGQRIDPIPLLLR